MIKVCPTCGKEFETKSSQKVFCSYACRPSSNRIPNSKPPKIVTGTCQYCEKKFTYASKGYERMFCSRLCANRATHTDFKYKEKKAPEKGMSINERLADLKSKGITYADYQRAQTLAMIKNMDFGAKDI